MSDEVKVIIEDTTLKTLNDQRKAVIKWVEEWLYQVAVLIRDDAKAMAPVDTGLLERSIRIKKNARAKGGGWSVFTDVEYAPYQEFGFIHYLSGEFIQNPFLRPAAEKNRNKLRKVNVYLQGQIDRYA